MKEITLPINSLIQYGDSEDEEISVLRLIYSDIFDDIAFVIDVNSNKGLPAFHRTSRLAKDLESGIAKIILSDTWARIISEAELSEKEKEIRDKAWTIIEEFTKPENEPDVYCKKVLGKLVQKTANEHHTTPTTVYKYFRRYLQRGKTKNALLPDYQNSGGIGKERKIEKKLGRKRKFEHITDIGKGVNVDERIKKIFRVAISQFYYDPKETSLQTVYNLMLKEYFYEDYSNDGGIRKPFLISQDQIPTYAQFHYFYRKERNVKKEVISRKGKGVYELTHRAILGSATNEVFGPGSRYEIDATVADVYLVSRFNRNWIIGRPIVYIVIDVFSRMVAGVYVGLEGPSWLGAMMALANTVSDKVSFCNEYGIFIDKEDWTCDSLPETLLADGGELAGKAVETLATNLNVRIETTSPYRGDLKGIVERYFKTISEKVKPFLPGYVIKDADKRRGYEYRLDAKLDIYQFTKIIVAGILNHNRSYLNYYKRDGEMIENNVQAVPTNLWKWGVKNRSGIPRYFAEDRVKLNLLPSGYGKITRSGILFKKMEYSCEKAIKEGWFEKGNPRNRERVEIVYDFRNLNHVYLREANGRGFENCYLLPTEGKYLNRDYYEIEHYHNQDQLDQQLNQPETQQEFADFAAIAEQVTNEAEQLAQEQQNENLSKRSRISKITDNRNFEKNYIREKEAFELGEKEAQKVPATVSPFRPKDVAESKHSETNGNFRMPNKLELLKRIRNQKRGTKDADENK